MSAFETTLEGLDSLHSEDPVRIEVEGESVARELWHAQQMSAWLRRLVPEPDELLRIAVRGQHLQRWQLSRRDYPEGRQGYLKWRREQGVRASATTARLMQEAGYSSEDAERVASLIRKEGLGRDEAVQVVEDCACLVFLGNYFADFSARVEHEHMVRIVQKTWRKMSQQARDLALELPMAPEARQIVEEALSGVQS